MIIILLMRRRGGGGGGGGGGYVIDVIDEKHLKTRVNIDDYDAAVNNKYSITLRIQCHTQPGREGRIFRDKKATLNYKSGYK